MKEANIFICHNPFHFYISTQICKDKFPSGQFENWIVSPIKSSTPILGVNYIMAANGLLGKFISLWKIKNTLKQLTNVYGDRLNVFLPHIDGIIGNYAFGSSLMKQKGVKINLYYEGIVMLDDKRMDRKFPRFLGPKILLSYSILHRFVKHSDILPMDSSRIHKIYTPYPDKTPTFENKKVSISFQRENIKNSEGGALIVGVDTGEGLEESYKVLIEFIRKSNRIKKSFFKAHYADREKVFEKLADESEFQFTLVQDTRCIEEIIGELEVDMVICTHLSSALINLKMIYKRDLRVIFLAHPKTIIALGEENVDFASLLGIEILNLNQI